MNFNIQLLKDSDISGIVLAFEKIGWHKPESLYRDYLEEQGLGKRLVFVARSENRFAGYTTLKWLPEYPPFKERKIPEICDLNVLPEFRKQGLGTQLIVKVEEYVACHSNPGHNEIGIGVGMTADYGSAQRLYTQLKYVPDGLGLAYQGKAVIFGSTVPVDDDLVLWFTKKI